MIYISIYLIHWGDRNGIISKIMQKWTLSGCPATERVSFLSYRSAIAQTRRKCHLGACESIEMAWWVLGYFYAGPTIWNSKSIGIKKVPTRLAWCRMYLLDANIISYWMRGDQQLINKIKSYSCRSQIFRPYWDCWHFHTGLQSLHPWWRCCLNWFWTYYLDLKRIPIWLWKTLRSASSWPSWNVIRSGLKFEQKTVFFGSCFVVFGATGRSHWSSSNPKLSSGGIERVSSCSGISSPDSKVPDGLLSALRSVTLFLRWRTPIHSGVHQGFMASCSSWESR